MDDIVKISEEMQKNNNNQVNNNVSQGDEPQTMDPEAQSIVDEFNSQTKAEGQTQGDEPQVMDPEAQSIVDEFNSQTDNKAQDDEPQQDNNVVQNDEPQVVQPKEKYTMSEIMIYIHENMDKEFDRDKLAKVFNKSPLAISSAYNYVVQNYDLLTERINNMNSSKDNTANTMTR